MEIQVQKLSNEEPKTEEPGTKEPGAEEPGTKEPGTEEPETEEPGTEEPGTEEEELKKKQQKITKVSNERKEEEHEEEEEETSEGVASAEEVLRRHLHRTTLPCHGEFRTGEFCVVLIFVDFFLNFTFEPTFLVVFNNDSTSVIINTKDLKNQLKCLLHKSAQKWRTENNLSVGKRNIRLDDLDLHPLAGFYIKNINENNVPLRQYLPQFFDITSEAMHNMIDTKLACWSDKILRVQTDHWSPLNKKMLRCSRDPAYQSTEASRQEASNLLDRQFISFQTPILLHYVTSFVHPGTLKFYQKFLQELDNQNFFLPTSVFNKEAPPDRSHVLKKSTQRKRHQDVALRRSGVKVVSPVYLSTRNSYATLFSTLNSFTCQAPMCEKNAIYVVYPCCTVSEESKELTPVLCQAHATTADIMNPNTGTMCPVHQRAGRALRF